MLDGVLDVVRRDLDRQPDLVSGSSSTVAFTRRPLCQPLSGLEIEPPGALEEDDEQDDDENQQEYAATDVHLRLLSVVCGRSGVRA